MISRNARVNILIGNGHFLSHFYTLSLPPLFLFLQKDFAISYAELGLVPVVMSLTAALMQTPYGFLVDRFGARRFLVINTLVMSLAISAMGFAGSYWQLLILAGISGAANAVYHPADYTILAASIKPEKMGQAFAIHTFTGNAGFALAPPVVAVLASFFGWREALMIVGLAGVPVAAAIVWQSSILQDVAGTEKKKAPGMSLGALVFDRTMILFFCFYLLGSAAGSGVQAWLITILHQVKGIELALASSALTAYMLGTMSGIIFGGWVVDRSKRHVMLIVAGLTGASSLLLLFVGAAPVTGLIAIVLMFFSGLGLGGSRTPRDIMLKDAVPPSEIGKVFGFVSSGLALGSALTPVPFGYLIDHGYGDWVLILASIILVASILCMGTARASGKTAAALAAEAAGAAE
ncbi:MAG TPA: MFS transporter [Stellaceae bacterium]|nr:MFS transporter [Stellaceae bacterium]